MSNAPSAPVSDISAVITLMTNAVMQGNSNTMAIRNALERMTTQFADTLQQTIQMGVDVQAQENKNARMDKQFEKVKVFDGSKPSECHPWLEEVHALCIQTGRPFCEMLLLCAGQAVHDFITDMSPEAMDHKLPIIPLDNAFITSPVDIPGPRRVDLQDADITSGTRSNFDALCEKYLKVFSKGNEDIGRTQLVMMDIDTGDSPLVSSRPYTLELKHHRWVQEEIETLERVGIITKSMSPWASPIVIVPKKSQPGEHPKKRLCIDFRKINDLQQKVITEDKSKGCLSLIPLPKIDEMYAKLKGAKFFLTIHLRSCYYHIALGKDSRAKTAFVMPFGKYEFLQVPFGLAQALAFFQHLMNKVLDNCPFAMTYLDDIIIFSNTEEEHLAHIEGIFKRLEAADLKMKRSKCDFFKKHIHYLGHLISANGI